jgi:SAM-dependent methyltransferase
VVHSFHAEEFEPSGGLTVSGREIDLLRHYPRVQRNLDERETAKSKESREIARQFGVEYFDGDRSHGYGGFNYDPRFWEPVIPDFVRHFGLSADSSILDVGCAKGFMLHDFSRLLPGVTLAGVDISEYAVEHAVPEIRPLVQVANAIDLPFDDNSFDVVISINTVHNLDRSDCKRALSEIQRVASQGAFVTVDAYRNEVERTRMEKWNLTALTMMSTTEWEQFFEDAGYSGDYFWFIP